MKKFFVNIAIGIVAAVGFTSCIQSHTVVTVNKDGSATIEEKTVMSGMIAQMMQGFGAALGEEGEEGGAPQANQNPLMDKKSYESRAAKMGEGVKLTQLKEVKDAKGGIGVHAIFTVPDINKLKLSGSGAEMPEALKGLAPEAEEELKAQAEEADPITFALKDGQLTINMPQPEVDPEAEKANNELEGLEPELKLGPEQAQQMEMAKMMLNDMAISMKVKVADGIAKTDASFRKDGEITLIEMKFSELLKDPKAFAKMAMMGEDAQQDQSKALAMLKGLPGVKVETKKKISVTLK